MERRLTLRQCLDAGFTNAAYLDPQALELLPDVRRMCEVNRCGRYGSSWVCPPACGTLEELEQKLRSFPYGVLLQVTGGMENDYDIDAIERTEADCKAALLRLAGALRPHYRRILPLGAGACPHCEQCAYPDAPCRFPELAAPSLEACGLFVSRECERAGIPYYYGPRTMTFSAAILVED